MPDAAPAATVPGAPPDGSEAAADAGGRAPSSATAAPEPALVPLTHPADGVPPVLTRPEELADLASALAAGRGPVAVDAERASGFRYGQRAYLVQLRREGVGTALIDPVALPDLSPVTAALEGVEWVVHAAGQDLPCLAEVGLRPSALFDTELAGRLLGRERVGLASIVAEELGLHLAKEHSAADWSTRPLPEPWLRYAALDVEVLVELRVRLGAHLAAAGKAAWAEQEFEAVRVAPAPVARAEGWRRVSGLYRVRDARRLAVARELWVERDALARARDVSPGRVIPDAAIVAAAQALPRTVGHLAQVEGFTGRSTRRQVARWYAAVERALDLPEEALPQRRAPGEDTLPPPRAWAERHPEAADRLDRVRTLVRALAHAHALPQENLLAPDTQRRIAWDPPDGEPDAVVAYLAAAGARPWQIDLVTPAIVAALRAARNSG